MLKPAEDPLNYRSLGDTPGLPRRRPGRRRHRRPGPDPAGVGAPRARRDLALLKTLGFTDRQLAATVAWHSTTAVTIGVAAGVPLGIALGRTLWDLFAHDINAVPSPSVPVAQVVLIAVGALVLANVIAAIPGRLAARTPTALVLRSE